MACGTPIVASNATSIPEVVGEAGPMVDPYNIEEIAQVMYEVITIDHLRDQYVARGLKRAKKFSYKKMAEQVLDVYTEVMNP
jgi:glycosyltransferase involved in cell wall biosynthesis